MQLLLLEAVLLFPFKKIVLKKQTNKNYTCKTTTTKHLILAEGKYSSGDALPVSKLTSSNVISLRFSAGK